MNHELYTLPQVAEQVGVSYDRLAYHLRRGRLPEAYRAGCHTLFTAEQINEIRRYFQSQDERQENYRVSKGRLFDESPMQTVQQKP